MQSFESRVSRNGQITLPAELRRRLGLRPNDRVRIALVDGGARIERATSRLIAGFGAVQPRNRPEDWQAVRESVELSIADEAAREGVADIDGPPIS